MLGDLGINVRDPHNLWKGSIETGLAPLCRLIMNTNYPAP